MNTNCPKCGKPMVEQLEFPGLWICPDFVEPINFAPPFKYKCDGMEMEDRAARDFQTEIEKQIAERN
jgi:ribosomal protein L37AE/L43A